MFLYFCIHIQKKKLYATRTFNRFHPTPCLFTTSCQYKEAQPHPAFKDSIVLVTPVEPQPIASKKPNRLFIWIPSV